MNFNKSEGPWIEMLGWEYRHSKHIYKLGERDGGGVLSQSIFAPSRQCERVRDILLPFDFIAFSLRETCVNLVFLFILI